MVDWGIVWGERHKAAAAEAAAPINSTGFNGNGSGYSVDQIEQIVRKGTPVGKNRSDVFHTIVGHYLGCGWSVEQILEHRKSRCRPNYRTGSDDGTNADKRAGYTTKETPPGPLALISTAVRDGFDLPGFFGPWLA